MDISCSFSLSIKRVGDAHARNVLWALAGALAATVILFASLGSIQNQCRFEDPSLLEGVTGFSGAVLGCKKLYRYYWFITSLNFVTGAYGAWIVARGFLARSRGAVLGLLVIANLLTINMTDSFLSMVDIPKWQDGPARDRVRTMIAGCIITAVFQAVSIILVGYEPNAAAPVKTEKPVAKSAPVEEVPKTEATILELSSVPAPEAAPAPAPEAAASEPVATPADDVEAPAAAPEVTPSAPEAAQEVAEPEASAVAVTVQ
ncbi:hypothetical protein PLESTB_000192900 [Pleodorina starrii]|uniref:Uncharacterized protein n=1 Tax=Pleodorina starrii TaxID=330485 RepID=A0A9W6EXQ9_9CHLO|nr:hypothetical protein PLESTB_000192900 [Pleodorina starrii]GLC73546.1 hypothetical protein PLESTF_001389900 [Pleodorina starrii]